MKYLIYGVLVLVLLLNIWIVVKNHMVSIELEVLNKVYEDLDRRVGKEEYLIFGIPPSRSGLYEKIGDTELKVESLAEALGYEYEPSYTTRPKFVKKAGRPKKK